MRFQAKRVRRVVQINIPSLASYSTVLLEGTSVWLVIQTNRAWREVVYGETRYVMDRGDVWDWEECLGGRVGTFGVTEDDRSETRRIYCRNK